MNAKLSNRECLSSNEIRFFASHDQVHNDYFASILIESHLICLVILTHVSSKIQGLGGSGITWVNVSPVPRPLSHPADISRWPQPLRRLPQWSTPRGEACTLFLAIFLLTTISFIDTGRPGISLSDVNGVP